MNYNYIAPFYDTLSKLCFFNRQQKAHKPILEHLKANDRILWLGGGSGWFLTKIDQLGIDLTIDYVEVSFVMINRAKKKSLINISVNFIEEDILYFVPDKAYDVIITAFIFDHFKVIDCENMFNRFDNNLISRGKWIYIDFCEQQNVVQRFITKLMVLFFNVIAGIKTNDFPKISYLFQSYQLISSKSYFINYIQSKVYLK